MPRGPHPAPLALSAADRATLVGWTRRRTTAQALALRARIVQACADRPGATHVELAAALRAHRATVHVWRARFAARGPAGLLDAPKPGAPRTINDAAVERVLTATLEEPPPEATHRAGRPVGARPRLRAAGELPGRGGAGGQAGAGHGR